LFSPSLVIFISQSIAAAALLFNLSFRAICDKGTSGVALFRGASVLPPSSPTANTPPSSRRFDFSRDVRPRGIPPHEFLTGRN